MCKNYEQEKRSTMWTQCRIDANSLCDIDDINSVNKKEGVGCRRNVVWMLDNIAL